MTMYLSEWQFDGEIIVLFSTLAVEKSDTTSNALTSVTKDNSHSLHFTSLDGQDQQQFVTLVLTLH